MPSNLITRERRFLKNRMKLNNENLEKMPTARHETITIRTGTLLKRGAGITPEGLVSTYRSNKSNNKVALTSGVKQRASVDLSKSRRIWNPTPPPISLVKSNNPYAKHPEVQIIGGSSRRGGGGGGGGGVIKDQNRSGSKVNKSNCKMEALDPFTTLRYYNPKFGSTPSLECLKKCDKKEIPKPKSAKKKSKLKISISKTAASVKIKSLLCEAEVDELKAKVDVLQKENHRLNIELRSQKDSLDQSGKLLRKAEESFRKESALKDFIKQREDELSEAKLKIANLNLCISEKDREMEADSKQLRSMKQQNAMLEKSLRRSHEELQDLKDELEKLKNLGQVIKNDMNDKLAIKDKYINKIKKERMELVMALKKQMKITDDLTKQKTCLEQWKMVGFVDKEFSQFLDYDLIGKAHQ